MAVLLFGAGFDSPASMVGLGTKLLLEHPRQAWMLAEDDELAPNAVAEILRYEPPVQLVARTALEPVELAGTMVEPGSMILGLVAAANRDPAQVKEPEVFDVARRERSRRSASAPGRTTAWARTWPACRARRCSPGCSAASPSCGWPGRRSTARPDRPCAAWRASRSTWSKKQC
jgi:cytochrome P450